MPMDRFTALLDSSATPGAKWWIKWAKSVRNLFFTNGENNIWSIAFYWQLLHIYEPETNLCEDEVLIQNDNNKEIKFPIE